MSISFTQFSHQFLINQQKEVVDSAHMDGENIAEINRKWDLK